MDKQIKEMAKVYCQNGFKCEENCQTNGCKVYEVCTELYNAGYRKIPENAVVLTEKESVTAWKNGNCNAHAIYGLAYEQARKETAEKFAERFRENSMYSHKYGFDYYVIYTDEFNEICKQITEGRV